MRKLFIIMLLGVLLCPLIVSAQTNESKIHSYKTYQHDASDIKWAVGQSIRAYMVSLGLDTLPAWMDSVEVAINNNFLAINAIVTDLTTNYWTSSVTKNYVDGTDENIINNLIPAKADLTYVNATDEVHTAELLRLETDKADTDSVSAISDALSSHTNEVSGAHAGTAISVDASGFDGNLATTDDTVQKVAQKLDDLDISAIKKITVDGDTGTTGSTVKFVSGTNVTITRTDDTVEIAATASGSGATATEDTGTYISDNTTWEFSTEYDTSAVLIYRNRVYQPRKIFTTSVVSSKTRVTFINAISTSDEILLISNK